MFCKFILADTALNVLRQFQTFTLRPFYNVRTAFTLMLGQVLILILGHLLI